MKNRMKNWTKNHILNIDTYIINLIWHIDRWDKLRDYFINIGISPHRYSGILSSIDDYNNSTYHCSYVEYNCMIAHQKILSNLKKASLIFEDDIIPLKSINRDTIYDIIKLNKYDMILFGSSQYYKHSNSNYIANKWTYGAFAYYITPKMANIILQKMQEHVMPIDIIFCEHIYPNYDVLVVKPDLFIADVSNSDIRGIRDATKYAEKVNWDLSAYGFIK